MLLSKANALQEGAALDNKIKLLGGQQQCQRRLTLQKLGNNPAKMQAATKALVGLNRTESWNMARKHYRCRAERVENKVLAALETALGEVLKTS